MVKLDKAAAKAVNDAEGTEYEPIPPGYYQVRLSSAALSDKAGASGHHYIRTEWEVADGEHENRRLFSNLSLSPKAAFKLKEFFGAFGVSPDTDTDELIGHSVTAHVKVSTINSGDRMGELTNEMGKLSPAQSEGDADDEI